MWQKYWKVIVLTVIIVASIGTFYVQYHYQSDHYQKFTFEKSEGDEAEVAGVSLSGYVQHTMLDGKQFKVSGEDGTTYFEDESFIKRLEAGYQSAEYLERKKEHRHFMRGKYERIPNYYEDEDYLAYASEDYSWNWQSPLANEVEVDVLDKSTNDRYHFKLQLDQSGVSSYIDIQAVTLFDDMLYVMVESDVEKGTAITQYAIDYKHEAIEDDVVMHTYESGGMDSYTNATYIFNEEQPNEVMMAFEKTTYTENEDGEPDEENTVEEMSVYDLATNKQKDVEANAGMPIAMDDEAIYFQQVKDTDLVVSKYDRQAGGVVNEVSMEVDLITGSAADLDVQYAFKDGKLYITAFYSGSSANPAVLVLDAGDMNVLYKGHIEQEKMKDNYIDSYFDKMEVAEQ